MNWGGGRAGKVSVTGWDELLFYSGGVELLSHEAFEAHGVPVTLSSAAFELVDPA